MIKDIDKLEYLEAATGLPVITMTGCQWEARKRNNPTVRREAEAIKKYYDAIDRPKHVQFKKNNEILTDLEFATRVEEKVRSGELFGFVKLSIAVPDHLRGFFQEFQPLVRFANILLIENRQSLQFPSFFMTLQFKNVDLNLSHAGEHMKEFAIREGVMTETSSRRSLIGSFHAEDKLMSTQLLRWYLEKGLRIQGPIAISKILRQYDHILMGRF